MQGSVVFKGTKNGIMVVMDENAPYRDILKSVEEKFAGSGKFFSGAQLHINVRGRALSDTEKRELEDIINKYVNNGVLYDYDVGEEQQIPVNEKFFDGIEEGITKFYKGTVRSGQLITARGNLVVIGDVNPGAELVAAGNIIVMGSLRGIVHAGCKGNREAVIAAFNLRPTQLRIADIITRSPDGEEDYPEEIAPEIAFVKGNEIYIDRYLPKKII